MDFVDTLPALLHDLKQNGSFYLVREFNSGHVTEMAEARFTRNEVKRRRDFAAASSEL
jgi:hypothetical protein